MVLTYHLDSPVYTEIIICENRVTLQNLFFEYSGSKRVRPDPHIFRAAGLVVTDPMILGDFTCA
jgi:hypothetical protein